MAMMWTRLLLLGLSLLTASGSSGLEMEDEVVEEPCLTEQLNKEFKYFYYNDKKQDIKILTSNRISSRLISNIFKIFGTEVLGYQKIDLMEGNDSESAINGFDPTALTDKISNCEQIDCKGMDPGNTAPSHPHERIPSAMMILDLWVPPNYPVSAWDLKDVGQLGPSGRFGWFLPSHSVSSKPIRDHWRAYKNPDTAAFFSPEPNQRNLIEKNTKDKDDHTGRYFCETDYCVNGTFEPPQCKKIRHAQNSVSGNCAYLLTDYPVNSSNFFSTDLIIRQIMEDKMFVRIVFLGSNLDSVISSLEKDSEDVKSSSYLLLHYHPSALTLRYNYTEVKFPTCSDPLMADSATPNCVYNNNRAAKVIWKHIEQGAPALYNFIERFGLTSEEYLDLMRMYNEDPSQRPEKIACRWLNHNKSGTTTPWYRQWDAMISKKKVLYISGIFPISGNKYVAPELAPVAQMAVADINNNDKILSNYQLELRVDDGMCSTDMVMKRFIDLLRSKTSESHLANTIGLLGPACSDTVEPIAGVSKHFRTVVITYSAEGSTADTTEQPYFFRTIAENRQYKDAYLATLKKLAWTKVASLTQDGQKYSDYISTLQDEFRRNHIEFLMNRKFNRDKNSDMQMYLYDLQQRGARIIIGDFYHMSAQHIMCEAYHMSMTQAQGYVWFLPGWYTDDWYDIDKHRAKLNKDKELNKDKDKDNGDVQDLPRCSTEQMEKALQGHMTLSHQNYADDDYVIDSGQNVSDWKKNVQMVMKNSNKDCVEKNENPDRSFDCEHLKPNKYSGYVYDAVWLYANALENLTRENKSYIEELHSERTVKQFVKEIRSIDFKGVTGRIKFPKSGQSRLSNVRIMQWYKTPKRLGEEVDMSERGAYYHKIGIYMPQYDKENGEGRMTHWNQDNIKWFTSDGSKPRDHSKNCGGLNPLASSLNMDCHNAMIVAFVFGFGVIFIALATFLFCYKRRYDNILKANENRMRALGLLTPTSVLTLDEWEIPRDRVVINRKLGEGAFGTVHGGESFFDEKGWVAVAVKSLKIGSSMEEKIDFLSEAEMMKRFDHKNIVKLLGVCTRNEPVYTVMEFMLYGDLKTYLLSRRHLVSERNREEMDEVSNRRLTSMALDVARGLSYLAELKYVHRDIACRNCLVNSSRTVKLADFGMTRPMYENDYYRFSRKGMLPVRWMAPESLADGLFTPMSDIWSYGVLLYEMITFGSFPFQGLSNNQVLENVKSGVTLTIPSGIKPQLETLLRSCWSITPTKRPTGGEVAELLGNNPRLVSPCIDVPLASVQIERTDSLEMIPNMRKPSGSISQTNKPAMRKRMREASKESKDSGTDATPSGAYSPMNGPPMLSPPHTLVRGNTLGGDTSTNGSSGYYSAKEPLLHGDADRMSNGSVYLNTAANNSYVPPGYIVLDHTNNPPEFSDYLPSSVASV